MQTIGSFSCKMLEYAAFMYLRALSFQSIVAILRAWYEKDVLSKYQLITHLELLSDSLPNNLEITEKFKPRRSGYYAIDGTWFKYQGKELVLLIVLDVETLDIVTWLVRPDETAQAYQQLLNQSKEIALAKGFFCDGDPGLLKVLRTNFPDKPIQLCVFHKYSRVGQIIPFTRPRDELDKFIKKITEKILFAPTKEDALRSLDILVGYTQEHPEHHQKLKKVVGVIKRNFDLLLTRYDNPTMSAYNNVLEGFNHIIKRKIRLMKGFKKSTNINRWLKLIITDWRFHKITSSAFKDRNGKSPLQLASCDLPKYHNWMTFVRTTWQKKSS